MQENRTIINVSNDDFMQFIGEIILNSSKLTLSEKSLQFIQHVKIINNKCEKCKEDKVEEFSLDLSSDNILKVYKCRCCGFEKTEVKHIG